MHAETPSTAVARRRLFPAPLLALALIAGCDDGGSGAVTASGPAAIAFTSLSHDMGVITDTKKHELRFPFTNSGGSQLVITQVKGDCGCTVPTLSRKVFAPGEGDAIEVVFDPKGKKGAENRTITVISNAGAEPVKITFTANIRPMLEFDTMYQFGTMELHEEHQRTVPFRYTDPDLTIKGVRTNNPYIRSVLIDEKVPDGTRAGDSAYRANVELTVARDAPWGVLFANKLSLDVRGRPLAGVEPVDYTYEMSLMGTIVGELRAQPTILALGSLVPNGRFEKSVAISHARGEPFAIIDAVIANSTMPGIQVRVEPAGPAAHRITVYGTVTAPRGTWVRGQLAIQTDVATEGILQIPLSGLIK